MTFRHCIVRVTFYVMGALAARRILYNALKPAAVAENNRQHVLYISRKLVRRGGVARRASSILSLWQWRAI